MVAWFLRCSFFTSAAFVGSTYFLNGLKLDASNPSLLMKNRFILSLLLALCAAGGGYWLGQHRTPPNAAAGNSAAPDAAGLPGGLKLPPVKNSPANAAEKTGKVSAGTISLAAIEAKILELKKSGNFNGLGARGEQD